MMFNVLNDPTHRPKVLGVIVLILVACLIWIGYQFMSSPLPSATVNVASAPDAVEARTLTESLRKDERFIHLEVYQAEPGVWVCTGEVRRKADVAPAEERANELKAGVEWRFEIVAMNP